MGSNQRLGLGFKGIGLGFGYSAVQDTVPFIGFAHIMEDRQCHSHMPHERVLEAICEKKRGGQKAHKRVLEHTMSTGVFWYNILQLHRGCEAGIQGEVRLNPLKLEPRWNTLHYSQVISYNPYLDPKST